MIEYRPFAELVEIRATGGKLYAEGVAVRYGSPSTNEIAPGVVEEIRSGAFTKSLGEFDQRAYLEHRYVGGSVVHDGYLGRRSNDTLQFSDTAAELRYSIELPDTAAGRDTAALLERQDIRGASVGMFPQRGRVNYTKHTDGLVLRSVGTSKLDHLALTATPHYSDTDATLVLRSVAEVTGHTVDEVLEAAAAGETAALLDVPEPLPDLSTFTADQLREALTQLETSTEAPDEERPPAEATVVHRRPASWFV